MNEFNEEGIQKIADLAGEDLETVINQFKAVKKADENYNSYAGIKEKSKGSVKFIIETAAIEK
jgi:putative membrane protein